ncbi:MAG: hypothetical protein OXQ31_09575 [Spirochaetaceae bacterium]|nr:hypothetical protein [Spirochaetaceae bacterium]
MSAAASLDDRVREVERRVDRHEVILEHVATREDLANAVTRLVLTMVITQIGGATLAVAVLRLLA